MSRKILLGIFMLFVTVQMQAQTKMKIGYANTDSILTNMQEFKTQQKVLESYSKQLQNQLKARYTKAEATMATIRERLQAGEITQAKAQQEAYVLQIQMQKDEADAQEKLGAKEQELLEPLYEKIKKGIETVAKANGYTHVFPDRMFISMTDSADITQLVIDKLKG